MAVLVLATLYALLHTYAYLLYEARLDLVVFRATRDLAEDARDAGLCLFSMQRYTDSAEMLQQYLTQSPYAQDRAPVEAVLTRIYKLLQKPSL